MIENKVEEEEVAIINVNLSETDVETLLPPEERSEKSQREFWFIKREESLSRVQNVNLEITTEKELLLAVLELNTKLYWELRKINERI
jgi:hypothetical protein